MNSMFCKRCGVGHGSVPCWPCFFKDILGFIWPWKSDYQPIFPKMQRTYSLFAKLWFVRPLIFRICDSSPRYLSNVTFGTSFTFQMRKKYIYEKNIFENCTSRGVNSGVAQFQRQFAHVSRHFEICKENKKKIVQKKLFWKFGLRFRIKWLC